jgi:hypothetical protein
MSEENLFEMIKLLEGQVKHLTQLVHLQHAEIRALRIYAVANIADMLAKAGGRKEQFDLVAKIVREIYDEHISTLEAKFPAIASAVDLRGELPQPERDLWYLLEKYYPPRDREQEH